MKTWVSTRQSVLRKNRKYEQNANLKDGVGDPWTGQTKLWVSCACLNTMGSTLLDSFGADPPMGSKENIVYPQSNILEWWAPRTGINPLRKLTFIDKITLMTCKMELGNLGPGKPDWKAGKRPFLEWNFSIHQKILVQSHQWVLIIDALISIRPNAYRTLELENN